KLEEIINKALEKDRDVRCQSAAELRADLKRLKRDTESGRISTGVAVTAESSPRRFRITVAIAGAALIVCLLVGWLLWPFKSRTVPLSTGVTVQRLTTNPTENAISASAISPDGKYLAYSDK